MNPTLLRSTEAAKEIGIKDQTLRKWRLLGKGPRYIRLGVGATSPVAYRREEIERWLESQTYQSTTEETVGK